MATLLTYAFSSDTPAFPQQILNPLAYRLEVFDDNEAALLKARYIVSHSHVHHLALWKLEAEMGDAAIRAWITSNPDPTLGNTSEAHGVSAPPLPRDAG